EDSRVIWECQFDPDRERRNEEGQEAIPPDDPERPGTEVDAFPRPPAHSQRLRTSLLFRHPRIPSRIEPSERGQRATDAPDPGRPLDVTVIKSVCPLDCPDTCSMRVTVEDGVATGLKGDAEHPFTRGVLCQKMARYLDRVYSPDRLLHPLRRVGPKGEG